MNTVRVQSRLLKHFFLETQKQTEENTAGLMQIETCLVRYGLAQKGRNCDTMVERAMLSLERLIPITSLPKDLSQGRTLSWLFASFWQCCSSFKSRQDGGICLHRKGLLWVDSHSQSSDEKLSVYLCIVPRRNSQKMCWKLQMCQNM